MFSGVFSRRRTRVFTFRSDTVFTTLPPRPRAADRADGADAAAVAGGRRAGGGDRGGGFVPAIDAADLADGAGDRGDGGDERGGRGEDAPGARAVAVAGAV